MYSIRRRVAVAGSGWSKISRRSNCTLADLTIEACTNAIEDAGLTWDHVDGLATYPSTAGAGGSIEGIDTLGVEYLAQTLGLRELKWYISLDRGTIGAVLAAAINAIAVGLCDYAVVWKAMHTPPTSYGLYSTEVARGETQFRAPYGVGGPYNAGGGAVAEFSFPYSQYLARYKRTREEMAPYIVQNRTNAAENEQAVFSGRPITISDYLNAPLLCDPLSLLDCDMPVDGGGALLLTRAELADELPSDPVFVEGHAAAGIHFLRTPVIDWDDMAFNAHRLGQLALGNSQIGISDVESLSLYDGFSYFIPLWLEALGICGPGESFDWIAAGGGAASADLPVNVSGGNLGMGRLHGMPQLIEAVRHVQQRSVSKTNRALASVGSPVHGGGVFVFGSGG
jgi:acetyl-CoA acetyltransferase